MPVTYDAPAAVEVTPPEAEAAGKRVFCKDQVAPAVENVVASADTTIPVETGGDTMMTGFSFTTRLARVKYSTPATTSSTDFLAQNIAQNH